MTIDFDVLKTYLLNHAREILPRWLPGGRFEQNEFVCGSLRGESGNSFRYNIAKGTGADFSSGENVGDMIDLYAQINGLGMGTAAEELIKEYGLKAQPPTPVSSESNIGQPPKGTKIPDFHHYKYGDPVGKWTYRNEEGQVLFFVCRYLSEGRKHFSPWCFDVTQSKWVQKMWPDPRPLYGLELLASNPDKPIMIVEGEKTCDAARTLCEGMYLVMTWASGSNAFQKTDWSPIYGRKIVIWPDNDNPGKTAAAKIASQLLRQCPEIKILDVHDKPEGWDAADAVDEGMNRSNFFAWARSIVKKIEEPTIPEVKTATVTRDKPPERGDTYNVVATDHPEELIPSDVPASVVALYDKCHLERNSKGHPYLNVANVSKILFSMKEFEDSIWYDEFHKIIFTKDSKDSKPRQWTEVDDIALTIMIQTKFRLYRMTRTIVWEAVQIFARNNVRNEPKDWMDSLTWDQIPRVEEFLIRSMQAEDSDYTRAVSKNFWISMVARIYRPGCKVDEMMILEGEQGTLKSTALSIIGGKWYAKVTSDLGTKDFAQSLAGKMLMEMDELDRFGRAAETTIKQTLSTASDRYRPSYARTTEDFDRTCIFVGSTNEDNYLRDSTGGRRFWPVRIVQADLSYIRENRDQLFAEAVYRFKAGENFHEVPESAIEHQSNRMEVDEWEDEVERYVTGKDFVVISELAYDAFEISVGDLEKRTQNRIANILKRLKFKNERIRINGHQRRAWVRKGIKTFSFVTDPPQQRTIPNFAPGVHQN